MSPGASIFFIPKMRLLYFGAYNSIKTCWPFFKQTFYYCQIPVLLLLKPNTSKRSCKSEL